MKKKMMFSVSNFVPSTAIDPRKVGYEDSVDIIREELVKTKKSFVKIGWYLKHINDEKMYEKEGYADIFELAKDKFGITTSTANRFMNVCAEFSIGGDSPELDERFLEYSVSQLFEMLPMNSEERDDITPDMSVKEIRKVKQDKKDKKDNKKTGSNIDVTDSTSDLSIPESEFNEQLHSTDTLSFASLNEVSVSLQNLRNTVIRLEDVLSKNEIIAPEEINDNIIQAMANDFSVIEKWLHSMHG